MKQIQPDEVRFVHVRVPAEYGLAVDEPRGGVTLALRGDGIAGAAFCSTKDRFCKRKGRMIAKSRLAAYCDPMLREERALFVIKHAGMTVAVPRMHHLEGSLHETLLLTAVNVLGKALPVKPAENRARAVEG